jgi:hypothetical protein
MPLQQQNEQRHKQMLAKYMSSSSNNSNIQYILVPSVSPEPVFGGRGGGETLLNRLYSILFSCLELNFFPPQEGRAWERGCHLCRISELLQQVMADLNLKGFTFLGTPCMLSLCSI